MRPSRSRERSGLLELRLRARLNPLGGAAGAAHAGSGSDAARRRPRSMPAATRWSCASARGDRLRRIRASIPLRVRTESWTHRRALRFAVSPRRHVVACGQDTLELRRWPPGDWATRDSRVPATGPLHGDDHLEPRFTEISYSGPGWNRTNDLGIKSPLLCQLSYRPAEPPV